MRLALLLALLVPSFADAAPVAQWVWSRRDVAALASVRRAHPEIRAAVSVAQIDYENGVSTHLRLSPRTVSGAAWVVRFDDSFHAAWSQPAEALATEVNAALSRLLAAARAKPSEIQLDYDCPVSRLDRFAALVRSLRGASLSGHAVWVTSLVSHVQRPEYGLLFAGAIDGHIVQLFDTGDLPSKAGAASLARALEAAALPFRIGIGAFERGRRTRHEEWIGRLAPLATSRHFRGTLVFPAGFDWTALRPRLP